MKTNTKRFYAIAIVALSAIVSGLAPGWSLPASAASSDLKSSLQPGNAADNAQQAAGTVPQAHEPPWKRAGVVLDLGNRGDADDKNIESPIVLKEADGTYVMWYCGQTYADKVGRVMHATSPDGLKWTKTGVVMTPSVAYEGDKIDPMAVIFEDGGYKMWYGAEAYGGCACYATSRDGIRWTRYTGNPVLRKTTGNWDNRGAGGQHTIVKAGDKYYMYYNGYGEASQGWTFYGLAESQDGTSWFKIGKAISPDPGIGETTTFGNLFAFKAGGYYCIMYTMADYLNLYLCTSKDGKNWVKDGLLFGRGMAPGGLDVGCATSPCVIVDGDTVRMWYEGGDQGGRIRTLYAEISLAGFLQASANCVR